MANENFNTLVGKAMQIGDLSAMRPVVEKELLHYDILFALDKESLLDKITFQGGTALRLCYGGQRFSEDLDFAGGINFHSADLMRMKECIETYIGERYGLEVFVKEPKDMKAEDERQGIKVDKWQIRVVTAPERPDIPKQMIKIEVARVPAYTSLAKALHHNYDFLPDGYEDTLVLVESLDEIMADKLIAFPTCQKYIRYRDLWDLQWLQKQGAVLNMDFVKHKIADYHIQDYAENLEQMIVRLPEIIRSNDFKSQMARFIPMSVQERTLGKDKFYDFLENEMRDLFTEVLLFL
ncbi:MAG: nucleotidyl transferase AbiEii/AbiGii toxin family protein [Gammaproteobacteria bacterium]